MTAGECESPGRDGALTSSFGQWFLDPCRLLRLLPEEPAGQILGAQRLEVLRSELLWIGVG